MPLKLYTTFDFNQKKQAERWSQLDQLIDLQAFLNFVNDPANANYQRFGPYAMKQVKEFCAEVEKEANSGPAKPPIFLAEGASQNFVWLNNMADSSVLVWSCWKTEEEQRRHEAELDGVGCLTKLGNLAIGNRQGVRLPLVAQEDKAFMWKAPSFHPLQVLENAYQRVVRKAGQAPDADPIKAQSESLSRFFIQDPGQPECFKSRPLDEYDGNHLSAVKMNHLIETFYLFRLLVQFKAESGSEIGEALRVELSGDLTKLLHNGNPARMGWLSAWLTKKIGELGRKINELNPRGGPKRVIFFLKGGRALNYFLDTPQQGENDWDTQVVIDPNLPAEEWYQCFADVHDVLLVALKTFKTEFTELVNQNAPQFSAYLKDVGIQAGEDDEVDENEASDVSSLSEHANCKAELIDIGIPRRDSPSALEEWTHLSANEALLQSDGVIFPHREYYLNEYLMMVREAFLPNAEVRKAPKRIARLGRVLKSERGRGDGPSSAVKNRLNALPGTAAMLALMTDKGRRELLGVIVSQFVEAYNLHQDKELAAIFDEQCKTMILTPPGLPGGLGDLLDDGQKATATDVGTAQYLSTEMDKHWKTRNQFFMDRFQFFADFVRDLSTKTNAGLQNVQAQFAVAGSFAARLHANHLRLNPEGLEPIRRVLIKLQCRKGCNRDLVLNPVRESIKNGNGKFRVVEGDKQSLLLYWSEKVKIGSFEYAPLVMKVRVAEQTGNQLPVLSSIEGIPVLDPRYLVADYLRKTSKIDEHGSRRVLAAATAAVSEMLSRFDLESDDAG